MLLQEIAFDNSKRAFNLHIALMDILLTEDKDKGYNLLIRLYDFFL